MAWLKKVFIYIGIVLYIMKHPEKISEILVLTIGSTTATTIPKSTKKFNLILTKDNFVKLYWL